MLWLLWTPSAWDVFVEGKQPGEWEKIFNRSKDKCFREAQEIRLGMQTTGLMAQIRNH